MGLQTITTKRILPLTIQKSRNRYQMEKEKEGVKAMVSEICSNAVDVSYHDTLIYHVKVSVTNDEIYIFLQKLIV